jgi:phosphohistidine phosphatase SixA
LDALAPGHEPDQQMTQLARTAKRRRIALVGHEPGLGELAAHLVGARRPLVFRKGGACRIDLESLTTKRAGALIWLVTPKLLRQGVRS